MLIISQENPSEIVLIAGGRQEATRLNEADQ